MENKKITLVEIDTSTAEKRFEQIISQKYQDPLGGTKRFRTFFLNGEWGSGKSTFIEKIKKNSKKTFVNLKLWEVKDDRTAIAIAYSELHPVLYWVSKIVSYILVVLAILAPTNINVGLTKIIPFMPSWLIGVGMILAIVVLVHQFLKVKTDYFYIWLLPKFLKNKVLLIDDFDRIDESRQMECYKLFNILQGRLPIVFIGDYYKIAQNNNSNTKYLQKIIDRRIELPLALSPKVIVDDINKQFIEKLDLKYNYTPFGVYTRIRFILNAGNHNLRELSHFVDLLNYQLFELKKFERVEIEQFILVVYLFLFYPDYYKTLMRNEELQAENKESVTSLFIEILSDDAMKRGYYGKEFVNPNYFIDDYVSNLTNGEAQKIFSDRNRLLQELEKDTEASLEFRNFLEAEYRKFRTIVSMDDFHDRDKARDIFNHNKKMIENLALAQIANRGNINGVTDFVLQELADNLINEVNAEVEDMMSIEANKQLYKKLIQRLENFDLSAVIFFCLKYHIVGEYIASELRKQAIKELQVDEFFTNQKYPAYLCCLAIHKSIIKYNDDSHNIQQVVSKLEDLEFKTFFSLLGVYDRNKLRTNISILNGSFEIDIPQKVIDEFKYRFRDIEIEDTPHYPGFISPKITSKVIDEFKDEFPDMELEDTPH